MVAPLVFAPLDFVVAILGHPTRLPYGAHPRAARSMHGSTRPVYDQSAPCPRNNVVSSTKHSRLPSGSRQ